MSLEHHHQVTGVAVVSIEPARREQFDKRTQTDDWPEQPAVGGSTDGEQEAEPVREQ